MSFGVQELLKLREEKDFKDNVCYGYAEYDNSNKVQSSGFGLSGQQNNFQYLLTNPNDLKFAGRFVRKVHIDDCQGPTGRGSRGRNNRMDRRSRGRSRGRSREDMGRGRSREDMGRGRSRGRGNMGSMYNEINGLTNGENRNTNYNSDNERRRRRNYRTTNEEYMINGQYRNGNRGDMGRGSRSRSREDMGRGRYGQYGGNDYNNNEGSENTRDAIHNEYVYVFQIPNEKAETHVQMTSRMCFAEMECEGLGKPKSLFGFGGKRKSRRNKGSKKSQTKKRSNPKKSKKKNSRKC